MDSLISSLKINNKEIEEKVDCLMYKQANYIFTKEYLNYREFNINNSEILNIFGIYYKYIQDDKYLMKKYYLDGIKKKNLNCMYNLGLYYTNIDSKLSNKYYLMYIENKFNIDFDEINKYDDIDLINLLIKIFIFDYSLESIINSLNYNNIKTICIIYKYYSNYNFIVKKNNDIGEKYYIKYLENQYNFIFDNNKINARICFEKIKIIFENENNIVNEYYYAIIEKNTLENMDLQIIDILVLYYLYVIKNYEKISELYKKLFNLGFIEYMLKLSDIYKPINKKLSNEYNINYHIGIIKKNFNYDFTLKSFKFKKMLLSIFSSDNIKKKCLLDYDLYDIDDYNVLFVISLYYKLILDDFDNYRDLMLNCIMKKYDINENNIFSNDADVEKKILQSKIILDLFDEENKIVDIKKYNTNNPYIDNILGIYYEKKNNDIESAIKFYKLGIKKLNINCIYNLSLLFKSKLNNKNLYLKYQRMYFEYKFNIDLDYYDDNLLKKIIRVFSLDNIDDIEEKYLLVNITNIDMMEIISLYLKYVKKNIELSNKYYIKMIKTRYSIKFENDDNYIIDNIVKLYTGEIEPKNLKDDDYGNISWILGMYYQTKEPNKYKSLVNYKISYEKGNINASYNLGKMLFDDFNNCNIEDIELLKNCLIYSCINNNIDSIIILAQYHKLILDNKNMIRYYKKGVKLNDLLCLFEMGNYYSNINKLDKMNYCFEKLIENITNYKNYDYILDFGIVYYKLFEYNKCEDYNLKKNVLGYLINASKYNYIQAYYELGKYYSFNWNEEKMIKYYTKSIKNNHVKSMIKLADYYESIGSINKAIKYYKMGYNNGMVEISHNLAMCYKKLSNFTLMIKYLKISIEFNSNIDSMFELGYYYINKTNNHEDVKKYFDMGLELEPSNIKISTEYATYYFNKKKYSDALIYYRLIYNIKTFNINFIKCLLELNKLDEIDVMINELELKINETNQTNKTNNIYRINLLNYIIYIIEFLIDKNKNKDKDLIMKYIIKSYNIYDIDNEKLNIIYKFMEKTLNNNICKIYYNLIKIHNPNNFVQDKIKLLLMNNEVKFYSNKINLFEKLNNYKECVVCYNNEIHIDFECGHDICIECYCNMKKCHFRCSEVNTSNRIHYYNTSIANRRNNIVIDLSD